MTGIDDLALKAAEVVVTAATTESWPVVRRGLSRVWAWISVAEARQVTEALDADAARLLEVDDAGRARTEGYVVGAWEQRLRALLTERPDLAEQVRAVIDEAGLARPAGTVYHQVVEGGGSGAQGPGASATTHNYQRPT